MHRQDFHDQRGKRLRRLAWSGILLALFGASTREAAATTFIFVTTAQQRVTGGPGCSLQEAIFAANFHTNLAISALNPDGSDLFVRTNCASGPDDATMILPGGATFSLTFPIVDVHSPLGPAATPMIFSNITIEGNGSTLQWAGPGNSRLFSVGSASVVLFGGSVVSGTGNLVVRNLYVKGFRAKGGDGGFGGGGGLGAGGAIFNAGTLAVENCTFDGNSATGGNGANYDTTKAFSGGGGGGLGGNGGAFSALAVGGGGGGSRGDGSSSGGGGGTDLSATGAKGGLDCGGDVGSTGHDGSPGCPGGGGGGAGNPTASSVAGDFCQNNGGNGGTGGFGGGGGGGGLGRDPNCSNNDTGFLGGTGGSGGFGGGGGANSYPQNVNGLFSSAQPGGNGGFGGGGGCCLGLGGPFGGDGTRGAGGGGALGGAIFNMGIATIRNSTFTNNVVLRGNGASAANAIILADNGADAGGAIFSLNGALTVLNSTISGNRSTGDGGGLVVFSTSSTPALLTLRNTIIANNGGDECFLKGQAFSQVGSGNLIVNNFGCAGQVTISDPLLGPLQYNQGFTPTMAIAKFSPAFNAADPATSLSTDQRGQARPAMGGFDIGAFELCLLPSAPQVILPCDLSLPILQAAQLTMQVNPAGGGTTTPSVGATNYALNSIVSVTATASPGFAFVNWSGNVTDPANPSTTIVMRSDQTVTANFAAVGCVNDLSGRGTAGLFNKPDRIDLTWTAFASAASYTVLRGTAPGAENPVPIGTTTIPAYTDTAGLVKGTTYYYLVLPVNSGTPVCTSNEAVVKAP